MFETKNILIDLKKVVAADLGIFFLGNKWQLLGKFRQRFWNKRLKKVDDYTTSNVFEWFRAWFLPFWGWEQHATKKKTDHEILQLGTKSIIKKHKHKELRTNRQSRLIKTFFQPIYLHLHLPWQKTTHCVSRSLEGSPASKTKWQIYARVKASFCFLNNSSSVSQSLCVIYMEQGRVFGRKALWSISYTQKNSNHEIMTLATRLIHLSLVHKNVCM